MKLDFVCIGAQKAGTTTLHDILNSHQDIYLPPNKEALFFDVNERYEKGTSYYFKNFFQSYNNEKLIGNINPNLQLENRSIDRLIDCFSDGIKVIFILRDPVDRAYSHYLMSKRRGIEKLSFIEAIKKETFRIANPKKHVRYLTQEMGHYEKNHFGYIYRSHYLETVEYLFKKLPKNNVKLLLFEDFIIHKRKTIELILEFLGVPNMSTIKYNKKSNPASTPKSVYLRDFIYKPHPIKKFIGKLMSKENKYFWKNKLSVLNKKPLKISEKSISNNDGKWIYDTYFKEEVEKLEKLTDLNYERWKK